MRARSISMWVSEAMAAGSLVGCSPIVAILLPGCALSATWDDNAAVRTLALHAERKRRCRQDRRRARAPHDRGVSCLVGPQRRRERGERAAARPARDGAVGLSRGQRAI